MTITFKESFADQRSFQQGEDGVEYEITYFVRTDTPGEIVDEATVRTFAITSMPTIVDGVPRSAITDILFINNDNYKVKLLFKSLEPLDEEDEPITTGAIDSFDTTGGTEHISYGISRKSSGGVVSSELGAAINFDGDSVLGVDITIPRYAFSRTIKVVDAYVTDEYKKSLKDLTGSTNLLDFDIFAPNEVLFLGAVGTKQVTNDDIEDEWTITFNYLGQNSRENIKFNDGTNDAFTIVKKEGWDYLWVQYEDKEDMTQKKIVKKAIAAYVIQVYEQQPFSLLTLPELES